jgi:serine O-acetyltransferase
MNPVIAYEKKLYFPTRRDYLISRITHEDSYLIWKYLYFLRREEAASNKLTEYYWRRRKNDLGAKLGIIIYAGTCGKGLRIWHYGSTIISGDAKLGENCTFHGQACIGNDGSSTGAPVIGNNVDIGVGAKIIGDITIADGVKIGAGAVVTKSCPEENATLVGIPAKILSRK